MSDTPPQGTESEAPEPEPQPQGKSFTDEQLQRIMSREKKQGRDAMLRELGFDDTEAAKSFIAEVQKRQDAEKTEAQREREAAEQVRRSAEQERMQAQAERRIAKVERQLLRAGAPAEQLDRLSRMVSTDANDDDDIATDVEAIKADLPQLFAPASSPEAPKTPNSHVQGRPPFSKPVGEDPMELGGQRAAEWNKKSGINPFA